MQKASVETILGWLDAMAPFSNQEEFDNSGFQLGRLDAQVGSVLLALEVTEAVIEEAVRLGAALIITHHPLLFVPQRVLDLSRAVPKLISLLIKNNLSLISAHTNMDRSAEYSASATVAGLLGLNNIRRQGDYLFVGDFPEPLDEAVLAAKVGSALKVPVRLYQGSGKVKTLAIAGGAYSEGYHEAFLAGAQALLTGEVRHHHAVEAAAEGIALLDGGHYATEAPMLAPLALGLQKMANAVQYSLQVHVTRCLPYRLS